MCGRFVSSTPPDELARYFGADVLGEQLLDPSYNVAPTSDVYVVLADGQTRRLDAFHWGLVPFWAKDPSAGNRMINARAETLAEKNGFKHAFKKRRCLIPADGFYEWKAIPGRKTKQPYFIHRPDGEPYAFAGLWEIWKPKAPKGEGSQPEATSSGVPAAEVEALRSCTIVTTTPNEILAAVHDRMPVILPPSAWDAWLDPGNDDLGLLRELLVPAPPQLTVLRPVSTEVNNVRNKGAHLIEPVPDSAPESEPGGLADSDDGP